jgi:hypothetical protein
VGGTGILFSAGLGIVALVYSIIKYRGTSEEETPAEPDLAEAN